MIELDFKEIVRNQRITEVSGKDSDLYKEAAAYLIDVDTQIQDKLESYKNDLLTYIQTEIKKEIENG